ncbi:ATP-grasp domain-containing protein [Streptomyces sp. NPDC048507]|uniref:ATP-grasp domain-containing protein n=1 Tax=Streptomyces sp. NPDC048507 TaxID=3365560 RepID=UPI0037214B0B
MPIGTTTSPRQRPVAFLLGPGPAEVAAARRAGARAVVVAPGPSVPSDREGAVRRVRTDWRDHRSLVGALGGLAEVRQGRARVFGFGPGADLAAARANEALGLPGTPAAAVAALMDRAALRARSNTLHAARPVSFVRCGRAALIPFLAALIGYPCVVRPRAGSGGEGVRLLRDAAGAEAAVHDYPEVTDLLVEEYLEGPALTVTALSRQGHHRVLGWTRHHPAPPQAPARAPGTGPAPAAGVRVGAGAAAAAGFRTGPAAAGRPRSGPGAARRRGPGHQVPVALDAGTAEAVRALVRGVLDLAGHRDGPSHAEVALTPHGPRLVEAYARPGAEECTELLRLAHGTDVLGTAVAAGLGLPEPVRRPPVAAHAALRYVDFPPGCRLDGLAGALAAARAVPGVVRARLTVPADATVHHAPCGSLHHAYVLATGPTRHALARSLDRATALLCVPAPDPPSHTPNPRGIHIPRPRSGHGDDQT